MLHRSNLFPTLWQVHACSNECWDRCGKGMFMILEFSRLTKWDNSKLCSLDSYIFFDVSDKHRVVYLSPRPEWLGLSELGNRQHYGCCIELTRVGHWGKLAINTLTSPLGSATDFSHRWQFKSTMADLTILPAQFRLGNASLSRNISLVAQSFTLSPPSITIALARCLISVVISCVRSIMPTASGVCRWGRESVIHAAPVVQLALRFNPPSHLRVCGLSRRVATVGLGQLYRTF